MSRQKAISLLVDVYIAGGQNEPIQLTEVLNEIIKELDNNG